MQNISVDIKPQAISVNLTAGATWDGISGKPSATAEGSFMVSGASPFAWVVKTLAQVKTILGLGSAAYTASTDYAVSTHTHTQAAVTALPFATPAFANPLALDATTNKDFKPATITGATTVNLTGAIDGDAGMIELLINEVGGYAVALGAMFTKKLGATSIVNTANADNFISWRKVGADIVYTVIQKV